MARKKSVIRVAGGRNTMGAADGAPGSMDVAVQRLGPGTDPLAPALDDPVAIEEPLEIRLVYWAESEPLQKSISITMRTPGNDVELAIGFLFTEGIIHSIGDIDDAGHCGPPAPQTGLRNIVKVVLQSNVTTDLDRLERHFYTSSSCGVCGKASLDALSVQSHFEIKGNNLKIPANILYELPDKLIEHQKLFDRTGGIHASGLFDASGTLLESREDVGRHNALDKLIGSQLVAGNLPLHDHGILVSGRASFELMQKTMMAGCPMLAAVGAPSSLAVQMAGEFNMTLVGFLRDGRCNVYTEAHRVISETR